jgi:hypothetical protein
VAVPDPDVAGVVLGAGPQLAVTVAEQRSRIARARALAELGAIVAADRDGPTGLFGYPRRGVVHTPGCPAAVGVDVDVIQRSDAARAALTGDLGGLLHVRYARGRYQEYRWCPDCIRENQP